MQPWISRCGYFREYGAIASWLTISGGGATVRTQHTEPTDLKTLPYPVTTLRRSRELNILTPFEKRAALQEEKESMASAQTIQSMKVSGRGLFSPELVSMFPLILLAGLFVFIILKR